MGTWLNSDGLFIEFGTDESTVVDGGEYNTFGALHETEVEIPLATLSLTTQLILSDTVQIPRESRIERIRTVVEVAATSGGSATLDFGLVRSDRTTELDFDGFIAAKAVADYTDLGAVIDHVKTTDSVPASATNGGALIGTTLTQSGLLVAKAGTAVFTGGRLKARIYWYNT